MANPLKLGWKSAFRLLQNEELDRIYKKQFAKRTFKYYEHSDLFELARTNIHSVNIRNLMTKMDIIRKEGGMNRYIFRNEARVTKIIRTILEESCNILPLSLSVEVIEGQLWYMPSEEKDKKR